MNERKMEETGEGGEKKKSKKAFKGREVEERKGEHSANCRLVKEGGEEKKEKQRGRKKEGRNPFKKSLKVERSPVKETGGGWENIVREMRTGFRDLINEIRELKEGHVRQRQGVLERIRELGCNGFARDMD